MIAIVVPAHDEEAHIGPCLRSLLEAAAHPLLRGEAVRIIVVADACSDRTAALALQLGADVLELSVRNVGVARKSGASSAVAAGARWLAFTDADSLVSPDWLAAQLAQDADAVCGTIAVSDWGAYGERMRRHFELTYTDADGHAHVHGANLGVCARAYEAAGGFQGLATGEDVALVAALRASGANIAWSSAPRVITSARRSFKAPKGFGATLQRIEGLGEWAGNLGSLTGAAA